MKWSIICQVWSQNKKRGKKEIEGKYNLYEIGRETRKSQKEGEKGRERRKILERKGRKENVCMKE